MSEVADRYDVVIVGAGHGGAQVAISLREAKFDGTIALLSDEADHPYERPPLSKEYLAGDKPFERILLRKPEYWEERGIALHRSCEVVAVDARRREVTLRNGRAIGYGELVWAGGGRARQLSVPGADLAGVHSVRTAADIRQLESELAETQQVAVIGGGYIGLEAAAVLTKLGKQVTVLEALDRVLARVAGPDLSRFYEAQHRAHGVDLRLNAMVEGLTGDQRVSGVRLAGGEVIPAQLAIVGIGIVPAVEPLVAAGADSGNGICVDALCRTSLPHVWAIGDCAEHANAYAEGQRIRLESVQNAADMARVVAKAITGGDAPYDAVPWFWSNQYDLKLQTVGLSIGHDETVLRGDPADGSFSVIYLKNGRVIALDCVNLARDYVQGRKLVEEGAMIAPADLADTSRKLKELLPG